MWVTMALLILFAQQAPAQVCVTVAITATRLDSVPAPAPTAATRGTLVMKTLFALMPRVVVPVRRVRTALLELQTVICAPLEHGNQIKVRRIALAPVTPSLGSLSAQLLKRRLNAQRATASPVLGAIQKAIRSTLTTV
jgi:hypothetical protein